MSNRVPVTSGGRVIGWIANGVFVKHVWASKHQLRTPPAWAIDGQTFDAQVRGHATEIAIVDKEHGLTYRVSVVEFDRHKGLLDRGHGLQYFLVLPRWRVG